MEVESIGNAVKNILVEALCLDSADLVTPDADIINDLGAESIDFIDICFRIEKAFGLKKVNATEIFPFTFLESEVFDGAGNLLADVKTTLSTEYKHIDDKLLEKVLESQDKSKLFSVEVVEKYLASVK